ncbi:Pimeloyl-ACP methyl ester carboxylesterase [Palleronia marisminoris]|uniref:Palmitoyl-protein thioesterase ABHD10, mitochondrial n=1 Tax=Palleronia marisminoris TaxID=315423 RepID=A0A1Y5RTN1_9RHOB|nr:alpha/beta hydrolase [Palleronia marisminoris]SFG48583.1 Pimeloyl-ACP methyl ester carboxylesterase [Palleronia marisminoris]SLN25238.1 Alpha/beta hydrolase family protein [Palleronia marisminoris]
MEYLDTRTGRRIAYHRTTGKGPWVVFLGGFKSDMNGTKAVHLEGWAGGAGRAFLRFDYSGHGQSSGAFEDGSIGDWAQDAIDAIEALTEGPVVLVGSSMGGWVSLLVARAIDRVVGLVGIAAAPDFTEDSMWAGFDEGQRAELAEHGQVSLPSDYDEPYVITRRLIEDGRTQLVLREQVAPFGPVRLLQGTEDADVSRETALRLLDHLAGDVRLTFVKGADHRFSDDACLELIERTVEEVLACA